MPAKINIDKEKLLKLHAQGLSNSAIGRKLGVSFKTISNNLDSYGLKSNYKPSAQDVKNGMYRCRICNNFLDKERFEINKGGASWRQDCKKCRNVNTVMRRYSDQERQVSTRMVKQRMLAKELGIPFDLDIDYLIELLQKQEYKCFYTDVPLVFQKYKSGLSKKLTPSLDKIIPGKGYVKGNVVWTLYRINLIKNDMSLEEMKVWTPDWYKRIMNYSF